MFQTRNLWIFVHLPVISVWESKIGWTIKAQCCLQVHLFLLITPQTLYCIIQVWSIIEIETRAHRWQTCTSLNMTVSYIISHYFFIFQIRWMLWNLFGTECRWLHILLSLLSILIGFVEKEILALSSAASIHITIVCSVFSDTWSTASTISCWSSWFPSYPRTTSRGACCRLCPGAQRSCWHKREGEEAGTGVEISVRFFKWSVL